MKKMTLLILSLFSSLAFADKILSPGQTYISAARGERIACFGETSPSKPTFNFIAQGSAQMSNEELSDPERCTTNSHHYGSMLRAKEIALTNGQGIQCESGYTCEVLAGAVQYRAQGRWCTAYLTFRATKN